MNTERALKIESLLMLVMYGMIALWYYVELAP